MKVLMVPHLLQLTGEGGITTIVRKYFEHMPKVGIELVDPHAASFDVLAVHAGMASKFNGENHLVAHLHGLYWTADETADMWQFKANRDVITSLRHAAQVTVPSEWVAQSLLRDMHLRPHVVPHGIDWQEWQHQKPNHGYVLWNKNRAYDVCSPAAVGELAKRFLDVEFRTTFAPQGNFKNIRTLGVQSHADMRSTIQRANVYLATTKETFGVSTLEALASGVPVLGFAQGGTANLVEHGQTGYLAKPGDMQDLSQGLTFCLAHRKTLGQNAILAARKFGWDSVVEQLYSVYTLAARVELCDVTVIIPCFNYGRFLERAVQSALAQTFAAQIIIVNNNSTDDTEAVGKRLAETDPEHIRFVNCSDQGVAHARNYGAGLANTKYLCFLDADDEIEPGFLEVCIKALEADKTLGLAYTRLTAVSESDQRQLSQWPGEYHYDAFLRAQNQVPTCNVMRRAVFERAGGFRQRYAPYGAGAEDVDLWYRMGALGFGGKLASDDGLFLYHLGGSVSSHPERSTNEWISWQPWSTDKKHPFASVATPVNSLSHPVRQYDTPVVSVVIPSSKAHERFLADALDSLEAQSFRRWEVIVICDGYEPCEEVTTAYPFVRWLACTKRGAGAARNLGAEHAKGQYLFFLDADDWLEPFALERLLAVSQKYNAIAYSDYNGHAYIDDQQMILQLQEERRLIRRNDQTKLTVIAHKALDYDCVLAQRQPELDNRGEFYIWCLISSLVPRQWHVDVGGFDETMPTWEDYDYWLKLARKGFCFVRVGDRLLNYRFFTGERRELASPYKAEGRQRAQSLLEYLCEKRDRDKKVMCGNCSGQTMNPQPPMPLQSMNMLGFGADETVEVRLIDGNTGDHGIKGRATKTFYGYKKHGDQFLMNRRDVEMEPRAYMILNTLADEQVAVATSEPLQLMPPPIPIFDFTTIKGVTATHAEKLAEMGVRSLEGITRLDDESLQEIFTERQLSNLRKQVDKLLA